MPGLDLITSVLVGAGLMVAVTFAILAGTITARVFFAASRSAPADGAARAPDRARARDAVGLEARVEGVDVDTERAGEGRPPVLAAPDARAEGAQRARSR